MDNHYEPIVCNAGGSEVARGGLNLHDLEDMALSAERIEGGAAMTFPVGLESGLRGLVAQESRCCRWLSITMTRVQDEVRLEMTSDNPDGQPIIESFAGVGQL